MLKRFGPVLILILVLLGALNRILDFGETGKDFTETYIPAITMFLEGQDLYKHTVESYQNTDDIGGHGYAYFPGFLYLFGSLYVLALATGLPWDLLWKGSVLLLDLGTAIIIFKYLQRSGILMAATGAVIWLFNPYLTVKYTNYNLVDPIPVFFLLLAFIYLEKDDVLSGLFFTLSVLFKPFALIFLPLFLIGSKKYRIFIVACAIVFVAFSLPFISSFESALTYLKGTLMVHNDRVLQGRPFLFYLSYFYNIELFRVLPLSFYSNMATFFGWVLILAGRYLLRIRNVFILGSMSAVNFLIFTPVLNRTYLLWFLPIFILASYALYRHYKRTYFYYIPLLIYWTFCYYYLYQWKDGFHVWHP